MSDPTSLEPAKQTLRDRPRILTKAILADLADDKPTIESKTENVRVTRLGWGSFWLGQLITLAVLAGVATWFYQTQLLPQIRSATAIAPTVPVTDTSGLEERLSRANDQISTLQKQIDTQSGERERTQARLQEMADRMALVIKQNAFVPTADAAHATTADAAQVAAMMPSVSPSTSELILLKERNRLTDYADRAIATGDRNALQAIVISMFDPAMKHLRNACEAEFRRVQNYYEYSISIDPGYTLPLQDLFKDGSVRAEADLTPAQLIKLMHDSSQAWENRLRCAYLLRASTDKETNAALLKTLKEDLSLDVAKQAQSTFEKRVGRKFRLFDIPTIEAWWETQKGAAK